MDNDNDNNEADALTQIAELKLKLIETENEKDLLQNTFNSQIAKMEDILNKKEASIKTLQEQIDINSSITNNDLDDKEQLINLTNKVVTLEKALSQSQNKLLSYQSQCKEESDALLGKVDFLQKQILKLNQEKKKLKEYFEKNIVTIIKEKNEQIDELKKKNDELIKSHYAIMTHEEDNEKNQEILLEQYNSKYNTIKARLDKEIEIRKSIEMEYDKETSLLKEQICEMKEKSSVNLRNTTTGKLLFDMGKDLRLSLNDLEGKDDFMLDRSISLSFYPGEDCENYVERKDHIEEIRSIKEYYENIVNELKLKIIRLQEGQVIQDNDKPNKANFDPNAKDNGNGNGEDNETLVGDLVKQIILLKNDLGEMEFVKDSRILQMKKQNKRLVAFINSKFKSLKSK